MTQPGATPTPQRPWCLPCRSIDGSRVWAEHLGICCDWHWGYLSESDQEAMREAVKRRHPRGGRVRHHIEQIVIIRMDLRRQQPPNTIEAAWERDRADVMEMEAANAALTQPGATPTEPQRRPELTRTLLLTFALPDFYAEDLAESADFYDGDLTEAFYNEAGLISSTARLSIMSGDKSGNDLHSMRAVFVSASVEGRVPAHDEPEDERLTEALEHPS